MTMQPNKSKSRDGFSIPGFLLFIGLVLLLFGALVLISRSDDSRHPAAPRPQATVDPFRVFTTVRNDCGACGTDSPVGGWENGNGDAMIINADRTFFVSMASGDSFGGDWQLSGNKFCLVQPGEIVCFDYKQKVDAMTLDGAIFIRR